MNRYTDRQRVNAIIEWAKDSVEDRESMHMLFAAPLSSRKSIDAAIQEHENHG